MHFQLQWLCMLGRCYPLMSQTVIRAHTKRAVQRQSPLEGQSDEQIERQALADLAQRAERQKRQRPESDVPVNDEIQCAPYIPDLLQSLPTLPLADLHLVPLRLCISGRAHCAPAIQRILAKLSQSCLCTHGCYLSTSAFADSSLVTEW